MKKPLTAEFIAFGKAWHLAAGPDEFLKDDSIWRLKSIYEPYLAAHPLPKTGVALDIGAGIGVFALPFAAVYADWTVWCFEPEETAFSVLCENIKKQGLTNLIAVNAAVGAAAPTLSEALSEAISAKDPNDIRVALGPQGYFQHKKLRGFIEQEPPVDRRPEFGAVTFPTLPANALPRLNPDLVKFTAPGHEEPIVEALAKSPVSHMVGESWGVFPSTALFAPRKTPLAAYIPVAGQPLRLHRREDLSGRTHGLDVVVALYNSRDYILDCVDSIIGNDCKDIRALVVDDGSTDDSAALVKERYRNNPRVIVFHKPNGGAASARNYGRLMSEKIHITFMDGDDVADPQLFPELLELARYCGAELTQGGFEPGDATKETADLPRQDFGTRSFIILPGAPLMIHPPTIRRRIYRRDYLDNKNIWFPEHIRAFDDLMFQMLSLQYAGDVYCMDHVKLHARQHPEPGEKHRDERAFHALEVFRLVLKRSLAEGWNDFQPILRSYVNTVNRIHAGLRDDLQQTFLKGAAELWVYMQKSLGADTFVGLEENAVTTEEFTTHVAEYHEKLKHIGESYAWANLDAMEMQPEIVRRIT